MRSSFVPSRLVGLGLIVAVFAMGYTSIICLWAGIDGEIRPLQLGLGAFFMAVTALFALTVIEDQSLKIDRYGVGQLRIMNRGRLAVRRCVKWSEISKFTQAGLTCRMEAADFDIRLNLASFNDREAVLRFLEKCLPPGRMDESLDGSMRPSGVIVLIRSACALFGLLTGVSIFIFGEGWTINVDAHFWGSVIAMASAVWAARIVESGSIRMDDQGLEQVKFFHRGRFFKRRRLAWQDVVRTSPWLATCKFKGSVLSIRVDASYFSNADKVALFAAAHLRRGIAGIPGLSPDR